MRSPWGTGLRRGRVFQEGTSSLNKESPGMHKPKKGVTGLQQSPEEGRKGDGLHGPGQLFRKSLTMNAQIN